MQSHNNEPAARELWAQMISALEGHSRAVCFDAVATKVCMHPVPSPAPSLPDQMEDGREALFSKSRRPISEADILQKFAAETELEFKGREVTNL